MLVLDGSMGEGGGQVLRTSLALAALGRQPFRIEGIRARRRNPGLLRQHLTAVRAMAKVCGARITGDSLGSAVLTFDPGATRHGEYHFDVGTAGSATLVFQTVLAPLLATAGRSRIVIEGGTHNPMAPPFDFIDRTFLPLLRRAGVEISATLKCPGFYPRGGGRFDVELAGGRALERLLLLERGAVERVRAQAVVCRLPDHVARREVKVLASRLEGLPLEVETTRMGGPGAGNVVTVSVQATGLTETFTGFGERGVAAEKVAHGVANDVRKYLGARAPVGVHLADQLLLPLLLAGGEFRTVAPSLHTRTNIEVIGLFLPDAVRLQGDTIRVLPSFPAGQA